MESSASKVRDFVRKIKNTIRHMFFETLMKWATYPE